MRAGPDRSQATAAGSSEGGGGAVGGGGCSCREGLPAEAGVSVGDHSAADRLQAQEGGLVHLRVLCMTQQTADVREMDVG